MGGKSFSHQSNVGIGTGNGEVIWLEDEKVVDLLGEKVVGL